MTRRLFRALAPVVLAAFPFATQAQDIPLSITMDGAVALQAAILAEGTLTEAQVQVLKDIAHQKAAVLACTGFVLDGTRLSGVPEAVYPTDAEFGAMDEAAQLHLRSVMMLVLGTFLGGNLAIAAADPEGWCASATAERGRPDTPNRFWAD